MTTEPLPGTVSASPRPNLRTVRVTITFFVAVCTAAALFVMAVFALPGATRAAVTIEAADLAGHAAPELSPERP